MNDLIVKDHFLVNNNILLHSINCKSIKNGCDICKRIFFLLKIHSGLCKNKNCNIIICQELKKKISKYKKVTSSRNIISEIKKVTSSKNIISKIKKYKCDNCSKKYSGPSGLWYHIKKNHN